MMISHYNESVEQNHNANWPNIPDHSYKIFIIERSGKSNVLLNLIKHQQPDIDKM